MLGQNKTPPSRVAYVWSSLSSGYEVRCPNSNRDMYLRSRHNWPGCITVSAKTIRLILGCASRYQKNNAAVTEHWCRQSHCMSWVRWPCLGTNCLTRSERTVEL